MADAAFRIEADAAAQAWLETHPVPGPRVISYEVSRCCGGGKICTVRVRDGSKRDHPGTLVPAQLEDGSVIGVDVRAACRLPPRFGLTVRGIGPLKHLDLDLEADQWGKLLYE
jgi:hypothetical protein